MLKSSSSGTNEELRFEKIRASNLLKDVADKKKVIEKLQSEIRILVRAGLKLERERDALAEEKASLLEEREGLKEQVGELTKQLNGVEYDLAQATTTSDSLRSWGEEAIVRANAEAAEVNAEVARMMEEMDKLKRSWEEEAIAQASTEAAEANAEVALMMEEMDKLKQAHGEALRLTEKFTKSELAGQYAYRFVKIREFFASEKEAKRVTLLGVQAKGTLDCLRVDEKDYGVVIPQDLIKLVTDSVAKYDAKFSALRPVMLVDSEFYPEINQPGSSIDAAPLIGVEAPRIPEVAEDNRESAPQVGAAAMIKNAPPSDAAPQVKNAPLSDSACLRPSVLPSPVLLLRPSMLYPQDDRSFARF